MALSTVLCYLGQQIAAAAGFPSASISVVTLLTVALATAFAEPLRALVPAGEGIATILLQASLLKPQRPLLLLRLDLQCTSA